MTQHEKDKPKPHHLFVEVVTAAGSFPAEGFNEVPSNQPVKVELKQAAKELGITNTIDWIAVADGREIDIEKNYSSNNLAGHIVIKYGPRETGGGGGAAKS